MAIFSNSEVTRIGHELLSKVLAGDCKLKFTLMQAGDGFYSGDVMDLTELVNHRLDGNIVGAREAGMFTELDCKLTNQNLTAFLEFREIGIWANGMVDGAPIGDDILFAYANAGENASPMGPFNGVWLHEEIFTIRIYTANATDIQAEIVSTTLASGISFINTGTELAAENVQDALVELAALLKDHIGQTVYIGNVHGIRYYQGILEIWNGEEWLPVTRQDQGAHLGAAHFGAAHFGAT